MRKEKKNSKVRKSSQKKKSCDIILSMRGKFLQHNMIIW